jgi:hypothetical protein
MQSGFQILRVPAADEFSATGSSRSDGGHWIKSAVNRKPVSREWLRLVLLAEEDFEEGRGEVKWDFALRLR